jgi:hypothetical protein
MALIETPGSATANTYATLAEFNAYAANRVPALAWFTAAGDPAKEAALQAAARELDACFTWTGIAVDDVQALTWPRSGMLTRNGFSIATTAIPVDLKNAQCEMALQLGAGDRLGDNDPLRKGVTSLKAGSVALTFSDVQGQQSSREAADVAIRKMQSDLNYVSSVVPDEVRRLLVPSWFTQGNVTRPVMFEAY